MDTIHLSIVKELYESYIKFVEEYLPGSKIEALRKRYILYPNSFIELKVGTELVGVAFGWARKLDAPDDSSFVLDGIAVKESFQRHGYGKLLLSAFEKSAVAYGFSEVSVGSAGGYVEIFYIENGYVPVCYKTFDNSGIKVEKVFNGIADFESYKRINEEGFLVLNKLMTNS